MGILLFSVADRLQIVAPVEASEGVPKRSARVGSVSSSGCPYKSIVRVMEAWPIWALTHWMGLLRERRRMVAHVRR
ncbi:MAG: hypothetical protein O7B80_03025, partial [bacterium]|nr:hypothetical protein [bacterium]